MRPDDRDDTRLQAYLDGELDAAERAEVEQEVAGSDELRRRLERLRAANDLARASAPPPPPHDLLPALRAGVQAATRRWWEVLLPGYGRPTPTLVWGVTSTLVFGLVLFPLTEVAPKAREKARMADVPLPGAALPTPTAEPIRDWAETPPPAKAVTGEAVVDALSAEPAPRVAESEMAGEAADSAGLGTTFSLHADVDGTAAPTPAAPRARQRSAAPAGPGGPAGAPGMMGGAALVEGRSEGLSAGGDRVAVEPAPAPRRSYDVATAPAAPGGVTPGVARIEGESAERLRSRVQTQLAAAERLQAGEIDDNAMFGKYLKYLAEHGSAGANVVRFDARERYVIQVVDRHGLGVPDVVVSVDGPQPTGTPLFVARTDSSGQAVFFAGFLDRVPERFGVAVALPDREPLIGRTFPRREGRGDVWQVEVPADTVEAAGMQLDVAFVVDTTGSMGEEIGRIRDTIHEVARRISSLPAEPKLRLGLVLYRDRGDEYITKQFAFTGDVKAFEAQLEKVAASGGGDGPEDVQEALAAMLGELDWAQPPALRLAFLIGDAPPHLDYQDEIPYFASARKAAERGIKIFAVSSSGNEDVGEYVWRQLALLTRGKFLFITKGGAAGVTPHHVERQDYTVQALPDLVVGCVEQELAALGKRPPEVTPVENAPAPVQIQPQPVEPVYRPTPKPISRPVRRLPFLAYLLVLGAWIAGWAYAYHRSRQPLRRVVPDPNLPRWQPPEPDEEERRE